MIKGNESAMPVTYKEETGDGKLIVSTETGLTIRQHFAAVAMQGFMSVENKGTGDWKDLVKTAARISVFVADALIAELNKPVE